MGIHAIKLPDVGEGVAEAELVEWHVAVGDLVKQDDVIAAVMTDKATVLIVDDHRAVREEIAFALDFDGWRTREAEDGPSGLEQAKDPNVDLVLLDVKLPGMYGFEVLQKLNELRHYLPVVMIAMVSHRPSRSSSVMSPKPVVVSVVMVK